MLILLPCYCPDLLAASGTFYQKSSSDKNCRDFIQSSYKDSPAPWLNYVKVRTYTWTTLRLITDFDWENICICHKADVLIIYSVFYIFCLP